MKKRKELDALVPNGKVKKKSGGSGGGGNSSSGASHELLRGDDSDSTDTEEFSVLQPQKFGLIKKGGWFSGLCGACVPLCTLTLVTACVVGSGTLVWMQFGMRQEVDILRDHVQKVEESSRGMPGEFHSIHSQINELQKNQTSLKDDVNHISTTIDSMVKEIEALKKTAASLQKSVEEAPQLESLPKDVDSLSKSLASMGSKITDVETNLGLVKTQLTESDKIKQQNQDQILALKKRLDELVVPQTPLSSVDNQAVMAHIDSEITKVEDVISESNSSIWDKLSWATNDLHQHHDKIAKVEEAVRNLSSRILTLGVAPGGDNRELMQALVNDTVVSVIHRYLPSHFSPLLAADGAVAYPTLLQYIRNLTGLYVALLASSPSSSSPALNATYLVDLNLTNLVTESVRREMNVSEALQLAVIQKLNASLGNLWKAYFVISNDSVVVDAKLDHLQRSLDSLRPSTTGSSTASSALSPPASSVTQVAPPPIIPIATANASAESTSPRSGSVAMTAPPSSALVPAAAVTPAPAVPASATAAVPPPVVAVAAAVANGTAAAVVTSTNETAAAVPPTANATLPLVNGTIPAGNGTSGHIPKPSVTGGSLSHPELRPEEPVVE